MRCDIYSLRTFTKHTFSKQQYRPGMIILTMQLQRIVAKRLGNLKRINLLLSCLCKKKFCRDNGYSYAKICKYRLGRHDNYQRIPSKFSRTAKVVIDRAFILLHPSIFYNVDLSWINFSQRASHCNGLYGQEYLFQASVMTVLGIYQVKYKKEMGNLSFRWVKKS